MSKQALEGVIAMLCGWYAFVALARYVASRGEP